MPTWPGAWSTAGVALVLVSDHATGSCVPLRQTLPRIVVFGVPVTTSRVFSWSPGLTVKPGSVTDETTVSTPPTVRTRYAATDPPA